MNGRLHGAGLIALSLALAVIVAGCGVPGTISAPGRLPAAGTAPTPAPLPPVRFPQDEAPHRDLTEWWYYTGHLYGKDPSGDLRTYGFELTFFQTLRGQFPPLYAAHFAVSDIDGGQFHYQDQAALEPPSVIPAAGSTAGFDLQLNAWSMRGLGGHDHLSAAMAGYALDVELTGAKPAVLHAGNGIITYGAAGFSYYYSRPLMLVAGTLTNHGTHIQVTGQAWMDHQWGNFITSAGTGWDWYSIQLADNTEYMLYMIRGADKQPLSAVGTYIAPDGTAKELQADDIRTQALGTWTSPHTGGVYPSGWHIAIASQALSLSLVPRLLDQELMTSRSTGVAYWEGAVAIHGQRGQHTLDGAGYVELTGYAPTSPTSGAPPGA
jgi:predicted secreted hydrolase